MSHDTQSFHFSVSDLRICDAEGKYQSITETQLLLAAKSVLESKVQKGEKMQSPAIVSDYLTMKLGDLDHEVFAVLFLDAQHRLIDYVELFRGTITSTTVYPREVVKEALLRNAAAVIFAHNHPSGHTEPSAADREITKRLQEALRLFDIQVLDHIVVARAATCSFAERGLI